MTHAFLLEKDDLGVQEQAELAAHRVMPFFNTFYRTQQQTVWGAREAYMDLYHSCLCYKHTIENEGFFSLSTGFLSVAISFDALTGDTHVSFGTHFGEYVKFGSDG